MGGHWEGIHPLINGGRFVLLPPPCSRRFRRESRGGGHTEKNKQADRTYGWADCIHRRVVTN